IPTCTKQTRSSEKMPVTSPCPLVSSLSANRGPGCFRQRLQKWPHWLRPKFSSRQQCPLQHVLKRSTRCDAMAPLPVFSSREHVPKSQEARQQFAAELLALHVNGFPQITSWSAPARSATVWTRLALPD